MSDTTTFVKHNKLARFFKQEENARKRLRVVQTFYTEASDEERIRFSTLCRTLIYRCLLEVLLRYRDISDGINIILDDDDCVVLHPASQLGLNSSHFSSIIPQQSPSSASSQTPTISSFSSTSALKPSSSLPPQAPVKPTGFFSSVANTFSSNTGPLTVTTQKDLKESMEVLSDALFVLETLVGDVAAHIRAGWQAGPTVTLLRELLYYSNRPHVRARAMYTLLRVMDVMGPAASPDLVRLSGSVVNFELFYKASLMPKVQEAAPVRQAQPFLPPTSRGFFSGLRGEKGDKVDRVDTNEVTEDEFGTDPTSSLTSFASQLDEFTYPVPITPEGVLGCDFASSNALFVLSHMGSFRRYSVLKGISVFSFARNPVASSSSSSSLSGGTSASDIRNANLSSSLGTSTSSAGGLSGLGFSSTHSALSGVGPGVTSTVGFPGAAGLLGIGDGVAGTTGSSFPLNPTILSSIASQAPLLKDTLDSLSALLTFTLHAAEEDSGADDVAIEAMKNSPTKIAVSDPQSRQGFAPTSLTSSLSGTTGGLGLSSESSFGGNSASETPPSSLSSSTLASNSGIPTVGSWSGSGSSSAPTLSTTGHNESNYGSSVVNDSYSLGSGSASASASTATSSLVSSSNLNDTESGFLSGSITSASASTGYNAPTSSYSSYSSPSGPLLGTGPATGSNGNGTQGLGVTPLSITSGVFSGSVASPCGPVLVRPRKASFASWFALVNFVALRWLYPSLYLHSEEGDLGKCTRGKTSSGDSSSDSDSNSNSDSDVDNNGSISTSVSFSKSPMSDIETKLDDELDGFDFTSEEIYSNGAERGRNDASCLITSSDLRRRQIKEQRDARRALKRFEHAASLVLPSEDFPPRARSSAVPSFSVAQACMRDLVQAKKEAKKDLRKERRRLLREAKSTKSDVSDSTSVPTRSTTGISESTGLLLELCSEASSDSESESKITTASSSTFSTFSPFSFNSDDDDEIHNPSGSVFFGDHMGSYLTETPSTISRAHQRKRKYKTTSSLSSCLPTAFMTEICAQPWTDHRLPCPPVLHVAVVNWFLTILQTPHLAAVVTQSPSYLRTCLGILALSAALPARYHATVSRVLAFYQAVCVGRVPLLVSTSPAVREQIVGAAIDFASLAIKFSLVPADGMLPIPVSADVSIFAPIHAPFRAPTHGGVGGAEAGTNTTMLGAATNSATGTFGSGNSTTSASGKAVVTLGTASVSESPHEFLLRVAVTVPDIDQTNMQEEKHRNRGDRLYFRKKPGKTVSRVLTMPLPYPPGWGMYSHDARVGMEHALGGKCLELSSVLDEVTSHQALITAMKNSSNSPFDLNLAGGKKPSLFTLSSVPVEFDVPRLRQLLSSGSMSYATGAHAIVRRDDHLRSALITTYRYAYRFYPTHLAQMTAVVNPQASFLSGGNTAGNTGGMNNMLSGIGMSATGTNTNGGGLSTSFSSSSEDFIDSKVSALFLQNLPNYPSLTLVQRESISTSALHLFDLLSLHPCSLSLPLTRSKPYPGSGKKSGSTRTISSSKASSRADGVDMEVDTSNYNLKNDKDDDNSEDSEEDEEEDEGEEEMEEGVGAALHLSDRPSLYFMHSAAPVLSEFNLNKLRALKATKATRAWRLLSNPNIAGLAGMHLASPANAPPGLAPGLNMMVNPLLSNSISAYSATSSVSTYDQFLNAQPDTMVDWEKKNALETVPLALTSPSLWEHYQITLLNLAHYICLTASPVTTASVNTASNSNSTANNGNSSHNSSSTSKNVSSDIFGANMSGNSTMSSTPSTGTKNAIKGLVSLQRSSVQMQNSLVQPVIRTLLLSFLRNPYSESEEAEEEIQRELGTSDQTNDYAEDVIKDNTKSSNLSFIHKTSEQIRSVLALSGPLLQSLVPPTTFALPSSSMKRNISSSSRPQMDIPLWSILRDRLRFWSTISFTGPSEAPMFIPSILHYSTANLLRLLPPNLVGVAGGSSTQQPLQLTSTSSPTSSPTSRTLTRVCQGLVSTHNVTGYVMIVHRPPLARSQTSHRRMAELVSLSVVHQWRLLNLHLTARYLTALAYETNIIEEEESAECLAYLGTVAPSFVPSTASYSNSKSAFAPYSPPAFFLTKKEKTEKNDATMVTSILSHSPQRRERRSHAVHMTLPQVHTSAGAPSSLVSTPTTSTPTSPAKVSALSIDTSVSGNCSTASLSSCFVPPFCIINDPNNRHSVDMSYGIVSVNGISIGTRTLPLSTHHITNSLTLAQTLGKSRSILLGTTNNTIFQPLGYPHVQSRIPFRVSPNSSLPTSPTSASSTTSTMSSFSGTGSLTRSAGRGRVQTISGGHSTSSSLPGERLIPPPLWVLDFFIPVIAPQGASLRRVARSTQKFLRLLSPDASVFRGVMDYETDLVSSTEQVFFSLDGIKGGKETKKDDTLHFSQSSQSSQSSADEKAILQSLFSTEPVFFPRQGMSPGELAAHRLWITKGISAPSFSVSKNSFSKERKRSKHASFPAFNDEKDSMYTEALLGMSENVSPSAIQSLSYPVAYGIPAARSMMLAGVVSALQLHIEAYFSERISKREQLLSNIGMGVRAAAATSSGPTAAHDDGFSRILEDGDGDGDHLPGHIDHEGAGTGMGNSTITSSVGSLSSSASSSFHVGGMSSGGNGPGAGSSSSASDATQFVGSTGSLLYNKDYPAFTRPLGTVPRHHLPQGNTLVALFAPAMVQAIYSSLRLGSQLTASLLSGEPFIDAHMAYVEQTGGALLGDVISAVQILPPSMSSSAGLTNQSSRASITHNSGSFGANGGGYAASQNYSRSSISSAYDFSGSNYDANGSGSSMGMGMGMNMNINNSAMGMGMNMGMNMGMGMMGMGMPMENEMNSHLVPTSLAPAPVRALRALSPAERSDLRAGAISVSRVLVSAGVQQDLLGSVAMEYALLTPPLSFALESPETAVLHARAKGVSQGLGPNAGLGLGDTDLSGVARFLAPATPILASVNPHSRERAKAAISYAGLVERGAIFLPSVAFGANLSSINSFNGMYNDPQANHANTHASMFSSSNSIGGASGGVGGSGGNVNGSNTTSLHEGMMFSGDGMRFYVDHNVSPYFDNAPAVVFSKTIALYARLMALRFETDFSPLYSSVFFLLLRLGLDRVREIRDALVIASSALQQQSRPPVDAEGKAIAVISPVQATVASEATRALQSSLPVNIVKDGFGAPILLERTNQLHYTSLGTSHYSLHRADIYSSHAMPHPHVQALPSTNPIGLLADDEGEARGFSAGGAAHPPAPCSRSPFEAPVSRRSSQRLALLTTVLRDVTLRSRAGLLRTAHSLQLTKEGRFGEIVAYAGYSGAGCATPHVALLNLLSLPSRALGLRRMRVHLAILRQKMYRAAKLARATRMRERQEYLASTSSNASSNADVGNMSTGGSSPILRPGLPSKPGKPPVPSKTAPVLPSKQTRSESPLLSSPHKNVDRIERIDTVVRPPAPTEDEALRAFGKQVLVPVMLPSLQTEALALSQALVGMVYRLLEEGSAFITNTSLPGAFTMIPALSDAAAMLLSPEFTAPFNPVNSDVVGSTSAGFKPSSSSTSSSTTDFPFAYDPVAFRKTCRGILTVPGQLSTSLLQLITSWTHLPYHFKRDSFPMYILPRPMPLPVLLYSASSRLFTPVMGTPGAADRMLFPLSGLPRYSTLPVTRSTAATTSGDGTSSISSFNATLKVLTALPGASRSLMIQLNQTSTAAAAAQVGMGAHQDIPVTLDIETTSDEEDFSISIATRLGLPLPSQTLFRSTADSVVSSSSTSTSASLSTPTVMVGNDAFDALWLHPVPQSLLERLIPHVFARSIADFASLLRDRSPELNTPALRLRGETAILRALMNSVSLPISLDSLGTASELARLYTPRRKNPKSGPKADSSSSSSSSLAFSSSRYAHLRFTIFSLVCQIVLSDQAPENQIASAIWALLNIVECEIVYGREEPETSFIPTTGASAADLDICALTGCYSQSSSLLLTLGVNILLVATTMDAVPTVQRAAFESLAHLTECSSSLTECRFHPFVWYMLPSYSKAFVDLMRSAFSPHSESCPHSDFFHNSTLEAMGDVGYAEKVSGDGEMNHFTNLAFQKTCRCLRITSRKIYSTVFHEGLEEKTEKTKNGTISGRSEIQLSLFADNLLPPLSTFILAKLALYAQESATALATLSPLPISADADIAASTGASIDDILLRPVRVQKVHMGVPPCDIYAPIFDSIATSSSPSLFFDATGVGPINMNTNSTSDGKVAVPLSDLVANEKSSTTATALPTAPNGISGTPLPSLVPAEFQFQGSFTSLPSSDQLASMSHQTKLNPEMRSTTRSVLRAGPAPQAQTQAQSSSQGGQSSVSTSSSGSSSGSGISISISTNGPPPQEHVVSLEFISPLLPLPEVDIGEQMLHHARYLGAAVRIISFFAMATPNFGMFKTIQAYTHSSCFGCKHAISDFLFEYEDVAAPYSTDGGEDVESTQGQGQTSTPSSAGISTMSMPMPTPSTPSSPMAGQSQSSPCSPASQSLQCRNRYCARTSGRTRRPNARLTFPFTVLPLLILQHCLLGLPHILEEVRGIQVQAQSQAAFVTPTTPNSHPGMGMNGGSVRSIRPSFSVTSSVFGSTSGGNGNNLASNNNPSSIGTSSAALNIPAAKYVQLTLRLASPSPRFTATSSASLGYVFLPVNALTADFALAEAALEACVLVGDQCVSSLLSWRSTAEVVHAKTVAERRAARGVPVKLSPVLGKIMAKSSAAGRSPASASASTSAFTPVSTTNISTKPMLGSSTANSAGSALSLARDSMGDMGEMSKLTKLSRSRGLQGNSGKSRRTVGGEREEDLTFFPTTVPAHFSSQDDVVLSIREATAPMSFFTKGYESHALSRTESGQLASTCLSTSDKRKQLEKLGLSVSSSLVSSTSSSSPASPVSSSSLLSPTPPSSDVADVSTTSTPSSSSKSAYWSGQGIEEREEDEEWEGADEDTPESRSDFIELSSRGPTGLSVWSVLPMNLLSASFMSQLRDSILPTSLNTSRLIASETTSTEERELKSDSFDTLQPIVVDVNTCSEAVSLGNLKPTLSLSDIHRLHSENSTGRWIVIRSFQRPNVSTAVNAAVNISTTSSMSTITTSTTTTTSSSYLPPTALGQYGNPASSLTSSYQRALSSVEAEVSAYQKLVHATAARSVSSLRTDLVTTTETTVTTESLDPDMILLPPVELTANETIALTESRIRSRNLNLHVPRGDTFQLTALLELLVTHPPVDTAPLNLISREHAMFDSFTSTYASTFPPASTTLSSSLTSISTSTGSGSSSGSGSGSTVSTPTISGTGSGTTSGSGTGAIIEVGPLAVGIDPLVLILRVIETQFPQDSLLHPLSLHTTTALPLVGPLGMTSVPRDVLDSDGEAKGEKVRGEGEREEEEEEEKIEDNATLNSIYSSALSGIGHDISKRAQMKQTRTIDALNLNSSQDKEKSCGNGRESDVVQRARPVSLSLLSAKANGGNRTEFVDYEVAAELIMSPLLGAARVGGGIVSTTSPMILGTGMGMSTINSRGMSPGSPASSPFITSRAGPGMGMNMGNTGINTNTVSSVGFNSASASHSSYSSSSFAENSIVTIEEVHDAALQQAHDHHLIALRSSVYAREKAFSVSSNSSGSNAVAVAPSSSRGQSPHLSSLIADGTNDLYGNTSTSSYTSPLSTSNSIIHDDNKNLKHSASATPSFCPLPLGNGTSAGDLSTSSASPSFKNENDKMNWVVCELQTLVGAQYAMHPTKEDIAALRGEVDMILRRHGISLAAVRSHIAIPNYSYALGCGSASVEITPATAIPAAGGTLTTSNSMPSKNFQMGQTSPYSLYKIVVHDDLLEKESSSSHLLSVSSTSDDNVDKICGIPTMVKDPIAVPSILYRSTTTPQFTDWDKTGSLTRLFELTSGSPSVDVDGSDTALALLNSLPISAPISVFVAPELNNMSNVSNVNNVNDSALGSVTYTFIPPRSVNCTSTDFHRQIDRHEKVEISSSKLTPLGSNVSAYESVSHAVSLAKNSSLSSHQTLANTLRNSPYAFSLWKGFPGRMRASQRDISRVFLSRLLMNPHFTSSSNNQTNASTTSGSTSSTSASTASASAAVKGVRATTGLLPLTHGPRLLRTLTLLDAHPPLQFHKIAVLYASEGQDSQQEILRNESGVNSSLPRPPSVSSLYRQYSRFLGTTEMNTSTPLKLAVTAGIPEVISEEQDENNDNTTTLANKSQSAVALKKSRRSLPSISSSDLTDNQREEYEKELERLVRVHVQRYWYREDRSYRGFLQSMGWLVNISEHRGFKAKLDNITVNLSRKDLLSVYYRCATYEVMFHVPSLMPTVPSDKQQIDKKRQVGNDEVRIVITTVHSRFYRPGTIVSQFGGVHIIASPLSTSFASDSTSYALSRLRAKSFRSDDNINDKNITKSQDNNSNHAMLLRIADQVLGTDAVTQLCHCARCRQTTLFAPPVVMKNDIQVARKCEKSRPTLASHCLTSRDLETIFADPTNLTEEALDRIALGDSLYVVRIDRRKGAALLGFGPLQDGMIVSGRLLPSLIRKTSVHADRERKKEISISPRFAGATAGSAASTSVSNTPSNAFQTFRGRQNGTPSAGTGAGMNNISHSPLTAAIQSHANASNLSWVHPSSTSYASRSRYATEAILAEASGISGSSGSGGFNSNNTTSPGSHTLLTLQGESSTSVPSWNYSRLLAVLLPGMTPEEEACMI